MAPVDAGECTRGKIVRNMAGRWGRESIMVLGEKGSR